MASRDKRSATRQPLLPISITVKLMVVVVVRTGRGKLCLLPGSVIQVLLPSAYSGFTLNRFKSWLMACANVLLYIACSVFCF